MTDTDLWRSLLADVFDRVHEQLTGSLTGLSDQALRAQPGTESNPIGWLAWHLTRIQDDHLAGLAELPQAWSARGWVERFGLPYDPPDHGWGHTPAQVSAFSATTEDLLGYADDVRELTREVLTDLTAADFDRVIDDSWDPPVTLGVRVVSVVNEVNQHLGQIDYVAGLVGGSANPVP